MLPCTQSAVKSASHACTWHVYELIQVYDDVVQVEWTVSSLYTYRGQHYDKTSLVRPRVIGRWSALQLVSPVCLSRLEESGPENTKFIRRHQAAQLYNWPNDATYLL
jgi:hypothetical protein